MYILWAQFKVLIFKSYTMVSPGKTFLIFVNMVFLNGFVPVRVIILQARLSSVRALGTMSSMPFSSDANTRPLSISA